MPDIGRLQAERRRLASLHSYAIPDPPRPTRLDIFTRLANGVCGTPISALTLVDEDTVRFKSPIGLAPRACSRSASIYGWGIDKPGEIMVVEDVRSDRRFSNMPPAADDPQVRYYLGAPLRDQDGLAIGMLCVMDIRPRRPAPGELTLLRQVAGGAMAGMELYRCDSPSGRRGRARERRDRELPLTGWELMADWLAEMHPECSRRLTDSWVPHYVQHYPKLLERLRMLAGQSVGLDTAIP